MTDSLSNKNKYVDPLFFKKKTDIKQAEIYAFLVLSELLACIHNSIYAR